MEPEGSGERQGRSVAHCNGLSGGPKSSASAGRAIEPKLVRGLGPPVGAEASVEPEGSGERRRRSVSVRRRSVEHRKMLGLAGSNAVKDRSPSRTVRRTSSLERLGRDAKLPGERPRAFG